MATRVAVLSDSHVGQRISVYPDDFLARLSDFDLIIHAGDHSSADSYDRLSKVGKVAAISGNMDEIALSSRLPSKLILDIENLKIGVTHGWGPPVGLAKKVRKEFDGDSVDIIIFGHSHRTFDKEVSGVRMLNPGSLSGNLGSGNGSWGILTIDGDTADWETVDIDI